MIRPVDYVGVISPLELIFTSLKREALFFDVLAIPNVLELTSHNNILSACPVRSLEYLIEKEIVIDPIDKYIGRSTYLRKIGTDAYKEILIRLSERERVLAQELKKISKTRHQAKIENSKDFLAALENFFLHLGNVITIFGLHLEKVTMPLQRLGANISFIARCIDYDRRGIACDLRRSGINAFPITIFDKTVDDEFLQGKSDVIKIILNKLPEPDFETVSWEQLIDFKNDPDSKSKMLALRNWCNDIAKDNLTGFEILEKLEYLCHEYKEHIKLHKMKVTTGFLETMLMVTAEALEGLLRLKPTQTVKAFFSIKHKKVHLKQVELDAIGREVAYIIKAGETFAEEPSATRDDSSNV
ncbi:hypothetical protein DCC62_10860 [candidate division KSB1 bacterium]|nr:MAG: hypothetical protein DCC62_10860 [candidate division KSB1 bacterium]